MFISIIITKNGLEVKQHKGKMESNKISPSAASIGSKRGNILKDVAKMPPEDDGMSNIFEEIFMDVRVGNDEEVNDNDIVMIQENDKKLASNSTDPKVQKLYKRYHKIKNLFSRTDP